MSLSQNVNEFIEWVNDRAENILPGQTGKVWADAKETSGPQGMDYQLTITMEPLGEFDEVLSWTASFTVTDQEITHILLEYDDVRGEPFTLTNDKTGRTELLSALQKWALTVCPSLEDSPDL